VGPFRADILCKDLETGKWVLIENQLERTDHAHLGQLLTYASGLEAVTIVWIASRFTEEHRSTLDWLNKITDDSFRFFGVEVELWRIGNSPVAPKFNIVSSPNNWSQSVARAARAIDEGELSQTRAMQVKYWTALNQMLDKKSGPVAGNKKPQPQGYMAYPIGRAGFFLSAGMIRQSKRVRASVYIYGPNAKAFYGQLSTQKDEIENELCFPLDWNELRQDCRIATYLDPADVEDAGDWPRQHEWLANTLNQLHRVFASRITALTADIVEQGVIETEGLEARIPRPEREVADSKN
jgi:hypothetical protein